MGMAQELVRIKKKNATYVIVRQDSHYVFWRMTDRSGYITKTRIYVALGCSLKEARKILRGLISGKIEESYSYR